MKKGWLIALVLLLVGGVGAFFWYQRQRERAADEPHGTVLVPRLELGSFAITDIDDDYLNMTMKLLVDNPLPVGFKAKKVDYALYIDTALVVKDTYRKTVELEAGDSTTVVLPVKFLVKRFGRVLKELDRQDVDSTVYRIESTFDLDVPVLGQRTFSVTTKKKLPTLYLPTIKITDIDLGKFSFKQMGLSAKVEIGNRNRFPVNIKDTHYTVIIDGDVISDGHQPEPILIKPQAVTPVVFPVTVKPGKFDNVAWKALFEKKKTPYEIAFRCKLISREGNDAFDDSKLSAKIKGTLADLKELKK